MISAETLDYHHGKHHAAYVDELNELVEGTELRTRSLEEIIRTADGSTFDNAAQHWNHSFLWKCLSPRGGGEPEGPIADALTSSFASIPAFRKAFEEAALATFGSGWTWLVERNGQLAILQTKDAGKPMTPMSRTQHPVPKESP